MSRRKMTWQELKANGRKPSVWMTRQREEAAFEARERAAKNATEREKHVSEFLTLADAVNNSFVTRVDRALYGYQPKTLKPVEQAGILSLCLNGRRFAWPEKHPLTVCKNYAAAVATGAIAAHPDDRKMCAIFLLELSHGVPGYVFDVGESDLLDKAIVAFGANDDEPSPLRTISLLIYTGWKDLTGGYRFGDGQNPHAFDPRDVELLDAANAALQRHWSATGREWQKAA